jgi:hypothetical protein
MTVAAVGLFVAVRRSWGAKAFQGFSRSAVVALVAAAFSATVGRALAALLRSDGLVGAAVVAVLVASAVAALCALWIWIGDRGAARLALARLPVLWRWRTR